MLERGADGGPMTRRRAAQLGLLTAGLAAGGALGTSGLARAAAGGLQAASSISEFWSANRSIGTPGPVPPPPQPGGGSFYLSPEYTGGANDIMLIYVQNRAAYATPSVYRPLVGALSPQGEVFDRFLRSYLFLSLHAPSGNRLDNGAPGSVQSDWQWFLDETFGTALPALESALQGVERDLRGGFGEGPGGDSGTGAGGGAGPVSGTGFAPTPGAGPASGPGAGFLPGGGFGGGRPRPLDVYLMVPYPHDGVTDKALATPWGSIDGKTMNLSLEADRETVLKWFVQQALERWRAARFQGMRLLGFYWVREDVVAYHTPEITALADFIHPFGLRLLWIPWKGAEWARIWTNFGFDAAIYQPNYYLYDGLNLGAKHKGLPTTLTWTAQQAEYYHMGIELEFDGRVLTSSDYQQRFYHYLAQGRPLGYESPQAVTSIYDGGGTLSQLATDSALYWLYRDVYLFTKGLPIPPLGQ